MKYTFVKLPTGNIEIEEVRDMYSELKGNHFELKKWFPRPALFDKNGKQSWLYTGQSFDPKFIELIEEGWTHDHCEVCSTTLSEIDNQYSFSEGYFDGYHWVCKSCYDFVLKANDIEIFLASCEKIVKEY